MADSFSLIPDRLATACEEAEALARYFARHCPGGLEEKASEAYSHLLDAISQAAAQPDENSYKQLMDAYRPLACYTFNAHRVHGRSILDTTRPTVGLRAWLWDKRHRSVTLGIFFLVIALILQWLDTWSKNTPAVTPLFASLLTSCVPLLLPVAWGALGACTALAKRVSDRLSAMTYEENRMQGLPARIFLGAALALVLDILVFVEDSPVAEEVASLGFGPIAGAFLAGLFVQHIYEALESMIRRVSRAVSPDPSGKGTPPPA